MITYDSEKVIGLKLRLIPALWFALAACVPVFYYLLLFGQLDAVNGITFIAIYWLFSGLPISTAALCGFIFGAQILDSSVIKTSFQAAVCGLKVSLISYLIFMAELSIVVSIRFTDTTIFMRIYGMFVAFFLIGLLVLLFVGWLIAIAGAIAGCALFQLSRLSTLKSVLFRFKAD